MTISWAMMTVKEMLGILSNYLIPWLGFIVHPEKSSFVPQHRVTFMGSIIDSITMTVYPTSEKIEKIIHTRQGLLESPHPTVREVESALWLVISNFPAAKLGPLHCRSLNMDKTETLHLTLLHLCDCLSCLAVICSGG